MSNSRRKITFTMSERVASNSPDLLKKVADSLPNDDLNFTITDGEQALESAEPVDPQLTKRVKGMAKDTLDLEDQAIKQGLAVPKSEEEANGLVRQLRKVLREEGMRIVFREIFSAVMDKISS